MFKKFGQGLPESLVDLVSGMMEAKSDEPAAPDAEAIARRKRLQALKDKQEDDAAETSYKKDTSVRKVAGSAYGGAKQKDDDVNEALKGNQHKIDANKNGKVDAHDFKLLRAKKKVDEDLVERSLTPDEEGEKERVVKGMKKSMSGFKSRYGKDAKSVMYATATKLAKEEVEYDELVLDLREGDDSKKELDLPFEPDEKPKKSAVAGKYGYGTSLVKHLARQGIQKAMQQKAMKKETMMGKAGTTSEQTEIEESRGHKILATKLKQIDMMSSGKAPDLSVNTQSVKDKIKDAKNTSQVEIVKQKDTAVSKPNYKGGAEELDKKTHGYGKVVHKEETEQDIQENGQLSELSKGMLATYIRRASDPGHPKSNVNLSSLAAHKLAKGDDDDDGEKEDKKAYQRSRGIGLAAAKMAREEVETIDEVSKSQLDTYKASKEVIDSSKYGKHFTDKQTKQSAHRQSKSSDKSVKSVFGMKENIELDETATLDKYIKSMGYDPLNISKNKKVMFSKTNAFKQWATRQEDLYDGGQKGTQDIDSHMSPGATARG